MRMPSNLNLPNCTLVNRVWVKLAEAELIAAFQYEQNATEFARAHVASEGFPKQCGLTVTNTATGKQFTFWPQVPVERERQS